MTDGGELTAVFRALAEEAAQAGKDIGNSMGRWFEDTADIEEENVNRTLAADAENVRALNAIRPRSLNLQTGEDGTAAADTAKTRGGANRFARLLSGGGPLGDGQRNAMFSSGSKVSNAEVAESGHGLARTAATVEDVARRAGVELHDSTVRIIDDPEYIRYLDAQGACACAPYEQPGEIHLGPASFIDEKTLAATLAHEQEHVLQYASGYVPGSGDLAAMEAAAYAAERPAVARLLGEEP